MNYEYSECPFNPARKCYHDFHKNSCEMYDHRMNGCVLRSLTDMVGDYDGMVTPAAYSYDATEQKLAHIEAEAESNIFTCIAFNAGTIPPLLERIAKALEAIADK